MPYPFKNPDKRTEGMPKTFQSRQLSKIKLTMKSISIIIASVALAMVAAPSWSAVYVEKNR